MPSDGLDGSSTPIAGLTAWGQTKQGGGQGHVSGARAERRGTGTWQGSNGEFLLRVTNSEICSVAPETVS